MSNDSPPSNAPGAAPRSNAPGAAPRSNAPGAAPRSIGRYDVVAPLATGGMGELFLARRSGAAGFARLVVLKRLRPELGATATYRDMFFDEARLAARLTHPNVCEVHDLEEHAGDHFLAMPYLEGVPASALLPPPGAVDRDHVRLVAGILVQVCDGLHHAHELRGDDGGPLGVVHRDVSPGNVFVTTDGVVKLLDFGIAKVRGQTAVTDQGVVKGKLSHMAPEQLAGGSVDRRADLFCVGILGWEGLMGRPLFARASASLTAAAVLDEPIAPIDPPAVPPALAAVLASALARAPHRRPASAAALRDAIDAAMSSLGGPMRPAELARVLESRCAAALESQRARLRTLPPLSADKREPAPPGPDGHAAASATPAQPPTRPERPDGLETTVWVPSPPRRSRLPWIAAMAAAAAAVGVIVWLATRDDPSRSVSLISGTGAERAPSPRASEASRGADAIPAPVVPDPSTRREDAARSGPSGAHSAGPSGAPSAGPSGAPAERPRPAGGFVSIDSAPWAALYVGGKRVGMTPYIHKPMAAGKHKVKAVLEDGREKTFTVNVPAGREAEPVMLRW